MTPEERRAALVARVEACNTIIEELARGVDDSLKTKDQKQNRRKCSECGKSYLGQANSSTCGPTCRSRKSRG
jgi:hypothetical protein